MATIEIDNGSGFCFGVTTAIRKAEEVLNEEGHLYCLGDIVHNTAEVDRLASRGLETITHEQLEQLHDVKVLPTRRPGATALRSSMPPARLC